MTSAKTDTHARHCENDVIMGHKKTSRLDRAANFGRGGGWTRSKRSCRCLNRGAGGLETPFLPAFVPEDADFGRVDVSWPSLAMRDRGQIIRTCICIVITARSRSLVVVPVCRVIGFMAESG